MEKVVSLELIKRAAIIFIGGALSSTILPVLYGVIVSLIGSQSLSMKVDGINFWGGITLLFLGSLITSLVFSVAHIIKLNKSINKYALLITSGVYFWICIMIKPIIDTKFPGALSYLLAYLVLAVAINLIVFGTNSLPKATNSL